MECGFDTGLNKMSITAVEMILVELVDFPSPPVIQPPVAAVVRLKAVEDESLSPRKFPWKLACTGGV